MIGTLKSIYAQEVIKNTQFCFLLKQQKKGGAGPVSWELCESDEIFAGIGRQVRGV
jgi:hypothetical protein